MKKSRQKRIFFDLNHPADFHLFKHLIRRLKEEGYEIRISARKKDRLQELLSDEGITFLSRGAGSHTIAGKYLYGMLLLVLTLWRLIRFRPDLTLSLSSPYLILASRILGIPTICYDDNDTNPRLHPAIKKANCIFTPVSYPFLFHDRHFRIQVFKELAYLPPPADPARREGIFFRLTRTDTIHHSRHAALNLNSIIEHINTRAVSTVFSLHRKRAYLPHCQTQCRFLTWLTSIVT